MGESREASAQPATMKFQARLVMVMLLGLAACQAAKLDSLYRAPARETTNSFGTGHSSGQASGVVSSSSSLGSHGCSSLGGHGCRQTTGFASSSGSHSSGQTTGFGSSQGSHSTGQRQTTGFGSSQGSHSTGFVASNNNHQGQGQFSSGVRGDQTGFQ